MQIPKIEEVKSFEDKIPCHWNIKLIDDNSNIIATNSNSKEYFEGSIKDFNKRMRG